MTSTGVDWTKLLTIVNSLAGPLITVVALVAAVIFFRADRRMHTVCLVVGCGLIFALRVAHAVAWLPGIGFFDRGNPMAVQYLISYNTATLLTNLFAWILFVFGLLSVAMTRLNGKRTVSALEA